MNRFGPILVSVLANVNVNVVIINNLNSTGGALRHIMAQSNPHQLVNARTTPGSKSISPVSSFQILQNRCRLLPWSAHRPYTRYIVDLCPCSRFSILALAPASSYTCPAGRAWRCTDTRNRSTESWACSTLDRPPEHGSIAALVTASSRHHLHARSLAM